jgi:UDP-GlcNAc:undecaprenyl-phosphate/decaprenyl-phosphate GlcNAc-1-phosphate transferase
MPGYLTVAGVAAIVTFLLTFVVRVAAPRIGAVALPGPRSVHTRATPSLGGAAMFAGFLVAMGLASQLHQFHDVFADSTEPVGLLLAGAIMFVVGAIDDLREVSPPAKIAGQVLSGSILSLLGVTMLYFRVPLASYEYVVLSPDLAPLVTVLTVVVLANAINLIDGLDGLAAGIVMIAGAALFLYADRLFVAGLLESSNMGPLVAAITVGICAGFLPHNFSPARIFMGDAGAMFLGLLMATTTITVGGRTADPFTGQTYFYFAPLAIPLVILGVPIFDTVFSFLRRVIHRQSFAQADHEHLHHRLMRMGHGPRRAVVILWLWTALLSAVVLLPTFTNRGNSLVPLAMVALALLLYVYFHPGVRSARGAGVEEVPPDESGEVVELAPRRAARGK